MVFSLLKPVRYSPISLPPMAAAVSSSLLFSLVSGANAAPSSRRLPASIPLASIAELASVDISSEMNTGRKLAEGEKPPPPTPLQDNAKVFDETVVEPRGLSDFIEQSSELIRPDGGPPRWISPLDCRSFHDVDLPSLFFLPGIDGVGLGLVRHHQRLGKIFDVWCLHIPVMDRTPFKGLVEYVERTIKSENHCLLNMPVYLVGESLGACIALAVAARNPTIDFVLILANPATCFSKSQLQYLSSFLDIVPEPLHIAIPYFLDFLTGKTLRMSSAFVVDEVSVPQVVSGLSENLNKMLHSLSGEEYKLFWPEQTEFVRMASRFGATIVPFGVVGEDDIFELLFDYDDLRKVPFYDILDKRINQKDVRVRASSGEEVGKQDLYLPGLLPKIPGRFYYLFGKPIKTKGNKEIYRNREQAQKIYIHVKSEVENCISYLKEKREQDQFRNLLPRLLYQVSRGFTGEAPTFEL